jgi:hypothetical protein
VFPVFKTGIQNRNEISIISQGKEYSNENFRADTRKKNLPLTLKNGRNSLGIITSLSNYQKTKELNTFE